MSIKVKIGVAAAVIAALAILAGTAWLAVVAASRSDHHASQGSLAGLAAAAVRASAFRITSVTPSPGTTHLNGGLAVQIAFSAPLAPDTADPRLSPHAAGQWRVSGSTMTFTPDVPLPPSTPFMPRILAGPAGVISAAGRVLARPRIARFSTGPYSQLRLAELLSALGYLPVLWQSAADGRLTDDRAAGKAAGQLELAYSPPAGKFRWHHGYPAALRGQWRADRPNPLISGAVMAFRAQHHMAIIARTGSRFWHELFAAAESGQRNAVGYTYALANQASPETLTIWHNGHIVLRSLANTGIPVAPTAPGTFPVYLAPFILCPFIHLISGPVVPRGTYTRT